MTRILIVEDVGETRKWLCEIATAAFPACHITEAATMRAGLRAAAETDHDLALIDLGLPDGSGLEVLRSLRLVCPEAVPTVTTVMGDDASIVAALSAGAQGYLLKENPAELLTRQLLQLAEGLPAISPSVARRIMEHFRLTGPAANPIGASIRSIITGSAGNISPSSATVGKSDTPASGRATGPASASARA